MDIRITKGERPDFSVYVNVVTRREGLKKIHVVSQTRGGRSVKIWKEMRALKIE